MSSIAFEEKNESKPTNVDKYCGESASKVAGHYQSASKRIQEGGIAVGEDHAQPHARALVLDLIEADLVQHLYLEMPDLDTPEFGDNMTVGLYLRELAAKKSDVTKNEHWKFISAVLGATRARNEVTLADIVKTGVPKGMNVYLWDEMDAKKDSALPKGMARRNQLLAKNYSPPESAIGMKKNAVVLTGSAHLSAHHCGEPKHTIQQLCGIAQNGVFDLGTYKKKE